jgi:hypothetical protein
MLPRLSEGLRIDAPTDLQRCGFDLRCGENARAATRLAAIVIARDTPSSPPPRRATAATPSVASNRRASQTIRVAVAGSGPTSLSYTSVAGEPAAAR